MASLRAIVVDTSPTDQNTECDAQHENVTFEVERLLSEYLGGMISSCAHFSITGYDVIEEVIERHS